MRRPGRASPAPPGPGELLPLPTRIVVGISEFLAGIGGLLVLGVIVAAVIAVRFYYRTPNGHRQLDGLMLKVPIIGGILRKIAVARFSRTLSTLLSSGVPILQSLDITARTAGNMILEEAIGKVRAERRKVAGVAKEVEKVTEELRDSEKELEHVTAMIGKLPAGSDSQKRYLAEFEKVDPQVKKLRRDQREKSAALAKAREESEEMVRGLSSK